MDGQSPGSFTVWNLPPFLNFEKIVALGGGFGAVCCHKWDISSAHEEGDQRLETHLCGLQVSLPHISRKSEDKARHL